MNFIKLAYMSGYNYAVLKKSAAQPDIGSNLTRADINKMLFGLGAGALSGAAIGGPYRRGRGAALGAVSGAILSNPKLFAALISRGSSNLYNFANGGKLWRK